ncbi:hypothetical protein [Pseudozobellia sp. WGM2]|uniref:hypothetical protein n=1 Tax=Pseudozobellia sp. WGM2 TaxID=2787625 RepID=UPI001AE0B24B|nr:hypothetical protein [Pseudozobellia sp. WGM2]
MKNFGFDYQNKLLLIDDIEITAKLNQDDLNIIGYEKYGDYQDKYFYTLKKKIKFEDNDFDVTVVFKGLKLWLIEITHRSGEMANNGDYKKIYSDLYNDFKATRIDHTDNIQLELTNILRIEYK